MSQAPFVYESAYNSLCTITCNPVPSTENSNFTSIGTGFIMEVREKRLIIVTCAHVLLNNNGNFAPVSINYPITAAISNAKASGKKGRHNITVNLFVLGMDITADIAVLTTFLESEVSPNDGIYFGYNFSKDNTHLKWGDSNKTKIGTQIYSLTNAYAGGICESTGIIHDNDFVYATDSPTYKNQTSQLLTSMNVDLGSSGAPVLVVKNNEVLVIGIVAWLRNTNAGNFIGGASQKQMQVSYNKILKLNPLSNISFPYYNKNFDGNNGKGFLGIEAYVPLDQTEIELLNNKYPVFANSKYYNRNRGFVIKEISDPSNPPTLVPNSRVNNAKNLATNERTGIQVDDIILRVNNVKVNLNLNPEYVIYDSYNNRFKPNIYTILRPSAAEIMNFEVISDIYPAQYEYVSITSAIKLVTNLTTPTLYANRTPIVLNYPATFFVYTLIYYINGNFYPVIDENRNNILISGYLFNVSGANPLQFNNIFAYNNLQPTGQASTYNLTDKILYVSESSSGYNYIATKLEQHIGTTSQVYIIDIPSLSSLSGQ